MITITLVRDDTREIIEFWVTGHADYKNKGVVSLSGTDIVCAAVSAVVQTAVEGLKRYLPERIYIKKDKGMLHVEIIKKEAANVRDTVSARGATSESSVILETMLLGLKRIEENYIEHVRVTIT
jgi:uncharacterized protein YsxB (DUF464 family)